MSYTDETAEIRARHVKTAHDDRGRLLEIIKEQAKEIEHLKMHGPIGVELVTSMAEKRIGELQSLAEDMLRVHMLALNASDHELYDWKRALAKTQS